MHSFRLRLFIGLLAVALLALLLVILLTSSGISRRFVTYVSGNEDAEEQAIAKVIEHQLQVEGPDSIAPLADIMGEIYDRPITVTGPEGDVLFSSEVLVEETRIETGPLPADLPLNLTLSQEQGSVTVITTTQRVVSPFWSPAAAEGAIPTAEAAFLGDANQLLIIAAAAALLLAAGVALWLSRSFVRPVFALTAAAERLAEGDLSQRVAVERPDELGRLARSFNLMGESLQQQERLRRTMVGDVAHELRTPLANVRGYLEAIQDGLVAPDDATVRSLYEETLLLNHLVDDLQTLSLADAGQLHYDLRPLAVDEFVQPALLAVRPTAEAKQITVRWESSEALPPVLADADRAGQILRNLLANALTHTPPGGAIVVSAAARQDEVAISVQDSGPGVPPEHAPYLFERFYRADPSRERLTGGSGLGLAICKATIAGQNGRIGLEPHGENGATVTFTLPRA